MPDYVNTHKEFKTLLEKNADKLVVVDFTANWCGPCQMIAPYFEKLSETYKEAVFVKVDVDENDETSEHCGIQGMPTFQFYRNEQKIDQIVGANKKNLEETVKKHVETEKTKEEKLKEVVKDVKNGKLLI